MTNQQTQVPVTPAASGAPVASAEAAAPVHIPFGDPGGLGLAAFALTTFVLSVINAGWLNADLTPTVFGLAIFYGGIGQLIAGVWEFANRNTFAAVAFSSYGGFWLSYYFLASSTKLGDDAAKGVGVYLIAWGIFTLYMTIAALRTTNVVLSVFVALTLTFFALAIAELAGAELIGKVGGYLGLITAVLAWYGSFAAVTNSTFKRPVLPVGPRA